MKTQLLITCLVIGSYVACAQDGGERGKDKDAKIKTKTVMDIKIKPKKEIQFYFTDKEHFDNGILEEAVTEDLREIQGNLVTSNENYHASLRTEVRKFRDKISDQMKDLEVDLVVSEKHASAYRLEPKGSNIRHPSSRANQTKKELHPPKSRIQSNEKQQHY